MRVARRLSTFLLLLSATTVSAADKWIEVQSPNFRVISDGSDKQARALALNFEQIRAVVPKVIMNLKTDLPRPLVIVALRNENSLLKLAPKLGDIGGLFGKGPEKDYAIVRLDIPISPAISYGAYVHELVLANFPKIPIWLDVGLLSFFANSRIEKDRVLIGLPGNEVRGVRQARVFSLDRMIRTDSRSVDGLDYRNRVLYSDESWALVHFLFFGEGMGRGQKLGEYLTNLRNGADEVATFETIFGKTNDREIPFNMYLKRLSYESFVVITKIDLDPAVFAVRELSKSEADNELKGVRDYLAQRDKKKDHN